MSGKIKDILNKKKYLFIFILILIIVVAAELYRLREINVQEEYLVYPGSEDFLNEIVDGEVYEQEFKMPSDEPEYLVLTVATFQRVNNGTMFFVLCDANHSELKKWEVNEKELEDNSRFLLDVQNIKKLLVKNKTYYLKFYSQGSNAGNAITLRTSAYDSECTGLTLNGDSSVGKNIFISFTDETNIYRFAIVLSIIMLLGGIGLFILCESEKIKPEIKFFVSLMFIGTLMMVVLPPMTSPDEPSHFATAYNISNKIMGINPSVDDEGFVFARSDDYDILAPGSLKWYYSELLTAKRDKDFSVVSLKSTGKPIIITPIPYILPALGITIARLLNTSNIMLYYFGAFFNLLLYAIIVTLSFKFNRISRNTIVAVSFLPMISSTLATYSYDTYNNALIIAYLSYIFICIREKEKVGIKEGIILSVLGALFIPVKALYVPLCLLIILIPKAKFGGTIKSIVFKVVVMAVNVASLPIGLLFRVNPDNPNTGANEIGWTLTDGIRIVADTLFKDADFYIESLVGKFLGWLNVEIPMWLTLGFLLLLLVAFIVDNGLIAEKIKLHRSVFYVLVILMGFFMILFGFYVIYPYESTVLDHVWGVQGRYFIPYLFLIPFCFKSGIKIKGYSISRLFEFEILLSVMTIYEILQYSVYI